MATQTDQHPSAPRETAKSGTSVGTQHMPPYSAENDEYNWGKRQTGTNSDVGATPMHQTAPKTPVLSYGLRQRLRASTPLPLYPSYKTSMGLEV
jgi:hypothetical protein